MGSRGICLPATGLFPAAERAWGPSAGQRVGAAFPFKADWCRGPRVPHSVLPAPGACAASASGSHALSLWREPWVRASPRCSADRSFQPPALSELSNAGGVFRLVLDGSLAAAQRTPPLPPPVPPGRGRPRVFSRGLGVPPGTFVAASQPGRARCCKPHARSWISLVPPRALLCSRTPSGASLSFSRYGFVGLFGL